jgi:hypothetical protein
LGASPEWCNDNDALPKGITLKTHPGKNESEANMTKNGENYHHKGWLVRRAVASDGKRCYQVFRPNGSQVLEIVGTLAEARERIDEYEFFSKLFGE